MSVEWWRWIVQKKKRVTQIWEKTKQSISECRCFWKPYSTLSWALRILCVDSLVRFYSLSMSFSLILNMDLFWSQRTLLNTRNSKHDRTRPLRHWALPGRWRRCASPAQVRKNLCGFLIVSAFLVDEFVDFSWKTVDVVFVDPSWNLGDHSQLDSLGIGVLTDSGWPHRLETSPVAGRASLGGLVFRLSHCLRLEGCSR